MPVPPESIDDGKKSVAYQVGADAFMLPFSERGDFISWEMQRTYRVQYDRYVRGKRMSQVRTNFGTGYLVEEGGARPIGQGLLEFTRTFASVPVPRDEPLSYAYAIQFYSGAGAFSFEGAPPEPQVAAVVRNMNAIERWEYSTSPLAAIQSPGVEVIFGNLLNFGGYGTFRPNQIVLAQDTDGGIYKGGIYFRRGIYIRYPRFVNGQIAP